ncbi:MAG: NAD-dependent epimerase/dehydratase family protein [Pseudonocardiaceae bacterium]
MTGGAGFIGSHLCDRLINLGSQVLHIPTRLPGPPGRNA